MTNENRFPVHLGRILKTMCEYVNAELSDVDFDDKSWYHSYEWSEETQLAFEKWLYVYLLNNRPAREEILDHKLWNKPQTKFQREKLRAAARWWVFNYGWRIKQ